jgi:predicted exporter
MIPSLIILGIVPGTNVQLGFFWWLLVAIAVVGAGFLARRLWRAHTIRLICIYISLVVAMHRDQQA